MSGTQEVLSHNPRIFCKQWQSRSKKQPRMELTSAPAWLRKRRQKWVDPGVVWVWGSWCPPSWKAMSLPNLTIGEIMPQGQGTNRCYLPSDITIQFMHSIFNEKHPENCVSYSLYQKRVKAMKLDFASHGNMYSYRCWKSTTRISSAQWKEKRSTAWVEERCQ